MWKKINKLTQYIHSTKSILEKSKKRHITKNNPPSLRTYRETSWQTSHEVSSERRMEFQGKKKTKWGV